MFSVCTLIDYELGVQKPLTWVGCAHYFTKRLCIIRSYKKLTYWCCMTKKESLFRHCGGEVATIDLPPMQNVVERNRWQDKLIRMLPGATDNFACLCVTKPSDPKLSGSITHLYNKYDDDDDEHWHKCGWGENAEFRVASWSIHSYSGFFFSFC